MYPSIPKNVKANRADCEALSSNAPLLQLLAEQQEYVIFVGPNTWVLPSTQISAHPK